MAYEKINSAGWSRNGDTWSYNTTFKIKNNEFTFGKEFYTLTVRVNTGSMFAVFSTKYYPTTTDDIPALYLFGERTLEGVSDLLFGTAENGMSAAINIKRTTTNINNAVNNTTHSDYGSNLDYVYNQSNGRLLYGLVAYDSWSRDCTIEIDADFPIFIPTPKYAQGSREPSLDNRYVMYSWDILGLVDDGTCNNYITEIQNRDFSNIDKAINYYSVTNTIPSDKTYFIRSSLKVNGTPTSHKDYCFQILPEAKICLYQDEAATGDGSPNLHLIISQFPCLVKGFSDPDSAYTETSNPVTEYWHSGYWKDLETGVNYTGICSTNIPIFRGQENAQRYLDGELSESDALNGGNFANRDSSIGEELTSSDIPTISLSTSGIGSFAYALSETQLKQIMEDYLFTDDTQLQDTMKEALWAWGNNPIDFLIDCYYVPFSITSFYDTINTNLKFGTYQFPNTSYPAIKETNGNRLVLFDTTFEGVYGDWRDYTQFNYDLFLPFIGFVPLDVQKYLNKQVRCEMMFDITTHNLRYYLFVDNKITDRFDGSVGINIPLMATDIVNKAKHDRDIQYGLVSDALGAGTQIGMAVTSADFGGMATGLVGGINTIVNGVKKYQELNNRASSSVNGSFSSSMNVYDISYAYLRITERQMILPSELNGVYNFPSYYIGTLNNLSGYCEIDDIQLKSNCTESEYNEIKTLLKGGVIF